MANLRRDTPNSISPATWSSRPAFLLATIGGAIGLGNLWRFPYIAGENGGGGFVLIYLAFVFLLGLPVLAGEMLLGRHGRGSAVHSIASLVRSENALSFWLIIGWLSLLIPFVALSYYALIAAWALDYLGLAVINGFDGFGHAVRDCIRSANGKSGHSGNVARYLCRDDCLGDRQGASQWYRTYIKDNDAGFVWGNSYPGNLRYDQRRFCKCS